MAKETTSEWYLYQKGIHQLWWFPDYDAKNAISTFKKFRDYFKKHPDELKNHPLCLDLVELDEKGNILSRRNYYRYE